MLLKNQRIITPQATSLQLYFNEIWTLVQYIYLWNDKYDGDETNGPSHLPRKHFQLLKRAGRVYSSGKFYWIWDMRVGDEDSLSILG
ncbi:hypothetical protein RB195_012680 [Necator americanus]|uniref:Uncharacterized protein n=1 Tax=Necator americanus TaxID=51031 RepID=A0ABR1DS14_NECAM